MPKQKEITKLLPRIYKWNFENLGLFFFVQAQKQVFPTMTIEQGIKNYLKFLQISPLEWDVDCLRSTYTRMQKEFFKDQKDENTKKNK